MDLNDIWQENKRFISGVIGGAILFLIGLLVIQSLFGDELSSSRRSKSRLERQLSEARYDSSSREVARAENHALREGLVELANAVAFKARTEYRVLASSKSAVNHYHQLVAEVRESLLSRAGRANLFLDPNLGLPELSPASDEEIARYLEALDAISRAVSWAIDTGVARIEDVRIRLDPTLASRGGVGAIERTRVEFELVGTGSALTSFLRSTQRPEEHDPELAGQALTIHSIELRPARRREGESSLALSVDLVRLHGAAALAEDSQS